MAGRPDNNPAFSIQAMPTTLRAWSTITVAHLLLGVALLLGSVVRITQLSRYPLSDPEAEHALSLYQWWTHGEAMTATPAYLSLSTLSALLVGMGDSSARFMPLVAGLGTLWLLWQLRSYWGVPATLLTAFLMAISPLQTSLSRSADGRAFAQFALLLILVAWHKRHERVWAVVLAIAIGFGLTTSPLFYAGALPLGLALWLSTRRDSADLPAPHSLRTTGLIIAATAFLVATALTTRLNGLGEIGGVLSQYVTHFALPNRGWSNPINLFLRYEFVLTFLGLPCLFWAAWRGESKNLFLLYWIIFTLLVLVGQAGVHENGALLVLPFSLLIGRSLTSLLEERPTRPTILIATLTTSWYFILLVAIGRYTRLNYNADTPVLDKYPLIIALFLLMTFLIIAMFIAEYDFLPLGRGALLGSVITLSFLSYGAAWHLNHHALNRPILTSRVSDSDLTLLRRLLLEASSQTVNATNELSIASTIETPALRWYLRDFNQLHFVEGILPTETWEAIISPAGQTPRVTIPYALTVFDLNQQASEMAELDLKGFLREWLYFEQKHPLSAEKINLWLKLKTAEE